MNTKRMSKQTAERIIQQATGTTDSFAYCYKGAYKIVAIIEDGDALRSQWGYTLDELVDDSGQGYAVVLEAIANSMSHYAKNATVGNLDYLLDASETRRVKNARERLASAAESIRNELTKWNAR